ncbi:MAG: hypothetical protein AB1491_00225 [Thermodesulfobacteriota bacterium]
MPYYIKQIATEVRWRVYVVEADYEKQARQASCEDKDYVGYYHDNIDLPDKIFGPFNSREEAENKRPEAWVEDV